MLKFSWTKTLHHHHNAYIYIYIKMAHHFVDGIPSSDIPHECTSLSGGDIWAKSNIGTNTMSWYIHDSMPYYINLS
jgi:hypothetical protein